MADIDALLRGSIDMHVHHGPDVAPRRLDALETARQAQVAGMKAIVLKHHDFPTALIADLVSRLVPDIKVFGSISLNFEIGVINPHAVEKSARLGSKVVWMPTFSSASSRARMRTRGMDLEGDGFSIIDPDGHLVPEINPVLKLVKEHNMVLASGHLSPAETLILIDEARKTGIKKMVITHASDIAELTGQTLTLEDQRRLVQMGAFIEHCFAFLLPTESGHDPKTRVQDIKTIGAEHCIISTDLGQAKNPLPAEGMRLYIATLLSKGITPEEIELMVKINPSGLLDM
jgi:hypothetical protein